MSYPGISIRLGARKIGSGAFSVVFLAQDSTGRECAVKKSRVSLNVARPLLEYEAQVLRLLDGHQATPRLLGYGRFQHFEYLAMERLGNTLADVREPLPAPTIVAIAVQMLSTLEHIHGRGIVHRDIKPSNIVAQRGSDFSQIRLIDFGLARRRLGGNPQSRDLVGERLNIVGTLSWASLNAYHGIDLNPRDDLESLAFVLLYLLRGDLPWHKLCNVGTAVGRILQIREKMKAWPGHRLCEGFPPVFGDLLDYARRLRFDERIDYQSFRTRFSQLLAYPHTGLRRQVLSTPGQASSPGPGCPVLPGQLILAQLNAATSIEGYTIRQDNSSYWENREYRMLGDTLPFRPCIVLSTRLDEQRYVLQLLPLSRSSRAPPGSVRLSTLGVSTPPDAPNTFCYVFPRLAEFRCLPDQTSIAPTWRLSEGAVQRLKAEFCQSGRPMLDWEKTQDPNPDVRYAARMEFQALKLYVNLAPVGSQVQVDWLGTRGWFDESARIAKRRGWEDGFRWTGDPDAGDDDDDGEDSYFGSDHSMWENPQRERDAELNLPGFSLTLPRINQIL